MKVLRAWGRQILLSFVVLSAVFAAGFLAGTSSNLSSMQSECMLAKGTWANGFCAIPEASK